jgi:hypothetical protein
MDAPLEKTLADVVAFFGRQHVQYALIGGLAASLRGQPRVTADVDLVILGDVPRALQLIDALEESPFAPLFPAVRDVVERAFILPLRHRTTGIKVDVAIGLTGFEHSTIERAKSEAIAGSDVFVATAEDLVIMKILAGRPQDDQDLCGLVIAQGDKLDWEYCIRVADELGEAIGQDLAGQVRKLRAGAMDQT